MFLTNVQQKNGMSMYIRTVVQGPQKARLRQFALLMPKGAKKAPNLASLTYATFCHRLRQGPPEDSCGSTPTTRQF